MYKQINKRGNKHSGRVVMQRTSMIQRTPMDSW